MLRPTERWREFELAELRRGVGGPGEALRIADAMLAEARALGVLPGNDILAGIEVDLRLAKLLHVLRAPREDRP